MATTISTTNTFQSATLSPQEKLNAYWSLFEGLILPEILEVYWEQVWDLRKKDAFPPHAIWKDIFPIMCKTDKPSAMGKPKETGDGVLVPTAVVMPCRWFWEVTLALYYLVDHNPDRTTDQIGDGYWERVLLDCVEKAEVDPSLYANTSENIWLWLRMVATRQRENQFFVNPIYTVYLCRASTVLEQQKSNDNLVGEPMDYLQGKRQSPEVTELLNGIWKKTEDDCKKFLQKPKEPELFTDNVTLIAVDMDEENIGTQDIDE